jgi:hypothetical protein
MKLIALLLPIPSPRCRLLNLLAARIAGKNLLNSLVKNAQRRVAMLLAEKYTGTSRFAASANVVRRAGARSPMERGAPAAGA